MSSTFSSTTKLSIAIEESGVEDEGVLKKAFDKLVEGMNDFSDALVKAEVDFIFKPIGVFLKDMVMSLINLLNSYSVEIITLSIICCAIVTMVAPLWGDRSGIWIGRLLAIVMVGSIWRLII